jgi:CheY-like chemotaxis protein
MDTALETLVVDDSPSARLVLSRILETAGVRVFQSASATEALRFLRNRIPDLIFMDHTMPGMNGLEAIQAIHSDPRTASVPVVMYTAQNDENYLREAMATGAVDLISKPASKERIFAVLDNLFHTLSNPQADLRQVVRLQMEQLQRAIELQIDTRIQQVSDQLHGSLIQEIRQLSSQLDPGKQTKEMLKMVHTITDSKLHQLNIELRSHLSARLDVLNQDWRDYSGYDHQESQSVANANAEQAEQLYSRSARLSARIRSLLSWSGLKSGI